MIIIKITYSVEKYQTWLDWYNSDCADEIINQFNNVKCVFVFGGMLSDATKFTKEHNGLNSSLPTKNQTKFMQNGYHVTGLLLSIKLANKFGCQLNEICYDQCENSINQLTVIQIPKLYKLWHGYDVPKFEMHKLDSLQYYLLNKKVSNSLFDDNDVVVDKEFNLVFGMSVLTEDRIKVYENLLKIDNAKLFVKNKFTGEDSFIERDEYISHIAKSKFTLILPTYDSMSFSIFRLIESIYNDCLPLIGNDCYIEEIVDSLDIDRSVISEITIKYDEPIEFPTEYRRIELIEYFKSKLFGNNNVSYKMFLGE